MFTYCPGWIFGAFAKDRQSFLPSMIIAVRATHSCTVHCLKHDTLQNSVDSISVYLSVFNWTISSTFADSLQHGNEKCVLSSTVNCWNIDFARGSSTATCIANIWLQSSVVFVTDKRTHCPNRVSCLLLWIQYSFTRIYIYILHLSLHILHWPKRWHYWRLVRDVLSSWIVGSFCCVVSVAP